MVGSSVVVPFFQFFLSFLRVCHFFSFVLFSPFLFIFPLLPFFTNSFLLRICVYLLPLLLISVCFSGGFLVKEIFVLCFPDGSLSLGASVSECVSDSFGRSGYSLYSWQGRRFHPKGPFLPSTKDRPSESRAMRDRYP